MADPMRVLVVNAGSSSLKLAVVDGQDRSEELRLERWDGSGEGGSVRELLDRAGPVDAVGHRVVHGGPGHDRPTASTTSCSTSWRR
jgi:acetate kinase